jgi:hypothetical protein
MIFSPSEDSSFSKSLRMRMKPYRFIFFFIFFYSYVHTMFGSFLPPSPHPLLAHTLSLSPTPSLPGRNYFALISNFVEERV